MSNEKLTRDQQREAARAKAKAMREAQKKAANTKKIAIITGSIIASIALVGAVIWGITETAKQTIDNSKGPSTAFTNRGVTIGADLKVATSEASINKEVPTIIIYQDLQCPACRAFEEPNMPQILDLVKAGKYNLEIHPIGMLDGASLNEYSSRAGSALLCVADTEPAKFVDYNTALYANQPAEQSFGPDSNQLADLAKSVGVVGSNTLDCIKRNKWANWVKDSYKLVMEEIPTGSTPATIKFPGTPAVIVNGQRYEGELNNAPMFLQWLQMVAPVQ
jgi:protein-disulfide isomerase